MIPPLRQRLQPASLPRHRHSHGYVAVVLSGGYFEAGDNGRRRAAPGDVFVHRAFEAHLNSVPAAGTQVLNLPLPHAPLVSFGRLSDPEGLARTAERDLAEATDMLCGRLRDEPVELIHWVDDLAATLRAPHPAPVANWANERGLSREHVARCFRKAYGVSAQRYRFEAQARRAWREICGGSAPLASIAIDAGFSDQPHMTRAVRALTGRTPGAWRRSLTCKTGTS